MLPSFRLIAATFFCGFLAVFAGLRMAATLNDFHEALPVMAAHAAPITVSPVADRDARRGISSVPMMYDLRFAVSTMPPSLVRAAPLVFERPAPPLSIVPAEDIAAEAAMEPEPPQPEATVAATQPDSEVASLPSAAADLPVKVDTPAAAEAPAQSEAIEPGAATEMAPAASPAPDSAALVDAPLQEPAQAAAASDASDAAIAAVPTPAVKPKAVAKAKPVRKKRLRTAQRAAPASDPAAGIGGSPSSSFDNP